MTRILVSLVGNQAINNIRFIKEFKQEVDNFVFITTSEMEKKGKTRALMSSLNIPEKRSQMVIVSHYKFDEINRALNEAEFHIDDEYLINITGGTKPMSIGVVTHFISYKKAVIYYVPIGEGVYRQIHPASLNAESAFKKYIGLDEYLEAYGLQVMEKENNISKDFSDAEKIIQELIKNKWNANKVAKLKNAFDMREPSDRSYYSGGWFEEYIFKKLKDRFSLNENQIAFGVQLLNENARNEYDVVFIYSDTVYIVECKAYFGKSSLKEKIEKDLYKLGALDDDFGLKVISVYITTADLDEFEYEGKNSLQDRADALKVRLFDRKDLENDRFLKKIR